MGNDIKITTSAIRIACLPLKGRVLTKPRGKGAGEQDNPSERNRIKDRYGQWLALDDVHRLLDMISEAFRARKQLQKHKGHGGEHGTNNA